MFRRLAVVLCLVLAIAVPSFAKGKSGSHKSTTKTTSSSHAANSNVVHVDSYVRKNGTVVQAHDRTASNATKNDNWSTKGNVNPETGKKGTKPHDGEKPPV